MSERVLILAADERDQKHIAELLVQAYECDPAADPEGAIRLLCSADYAAAVLVADSDQWAAGACAKLLGQSPALAMVLVRGESVAPDTLPSGCPHLLKGSAEFQALRQIVRLAIEAKALERQNEALAAVLDTVRDCVICTNLDGRIESANPAVQSILGYEPAELVGKPLQLLFPTDVPGNSPQRLLSQTISDGQWFAVCGGRRKDGGTVPLELASALVRSPQGKAARVICRAHDLSERTRLISRLERLALTDELTGLHNYRYFTERLEHEFRRAQRYNLPLSCLMIDLDYLKPVNDTYGHGTGDQVLRAVAAILRKNTREVDVVTRYGGDEFAIIQPSTGRDGARICAEKLRAAVGNKPVLAGALKVHCTASFGVASVTDQMKSEQELLAQADAALLIAKQHGRNRVCEWDEVVEARTQKPAEVKDEPGRLASFRGRLVRLNDDLRSGYMERVKPLVEELESALLGLSAHSARVARYAVRLAGVLHLPRDQVQAIRYAALLHDVGKTALPTAIWHKPGPLTREETEQVQRHPLISETFADDVAFLKDEAVIIRHHHERWDGSGYPDGLSADRIPLGARILAVVNTYDALRRDRPYRKALSKAHALAEMRRCAGTQLDKNLVERFERMVQSED